MTESAKEPVADVVEVEGESSIPVGTANVVIVTLACGFEVVTTFFAGATFLGVVDLGRPGFFLAEAWAGAASCLVAAFLATDFAGTAFLGVDFFGVDFFFAATLLVAAFLLGDFFSLMLGMLAIKKLQQWNYWVD